MLMPEYFCWTRFGTEAGQSARQILARKEQERSANDGFFFWGIGNAIGPSMLELLRRTDRPEALFSPIRSMPRQQDALPLSVVAWNEASTLDGEQYVLPRNSLITSRFDTIKPRGKHYALVCYSETPLAPHDSPEHLCFGDLRNLLTDRPVGASQVTAVVRLGSIPSNSQSGLRYEVSLRARLMNPFFITLRTPTPLARPRGTDCWELAVTQSWKRKTEESGSRL